MTTEDLQQETEVNVKSLENEVYVLKIKGEGISLTFDSSMSGRILLEKLCENTGFRDMMMCMKPWRDQELFVKTIIIEGSATRLVAKSTSPNTEPAATKIAIANQPSITGSLRFLRRVWRLCSRLEWRTSSSEKSMFT